MDIQKIFLEIMDFLSDYDTKDFTEFLKWREKKKRKTESNILNGLIDNINLSLSKGTSGESYEYRYTDPLQVSMGNIDSFGKINVHKHNGDKSNVVLRDGSFDKVFFFLEGVHTALTNDDE